VSINTWLIVNKKIERQIFRENCKRKADDDISTGPLKIIRSELIKNNQNDIIYSDIQSVRKAMYDKRRKMYPFFPTSFDEAISQLKLVENDFCLFNADQFVFVPENDELKNYKRKFKIYDNTKLIFWRWYI